MASTKRIFVFVLLLTIVRAENSSNSTDKCSTCEEKQTVVLHSTCFKDLPIYRSNSPYEISRNDDQICIEHPSSKSSQTVFNGTWSTSVSGRMLNVNSSNSLSSEMPLTLGNYQVESSIFLQTATLPYKFSVYSLPVASFGSGICAKNQPITFMNDFTSTCLQKVTSETCAESLSTIPYQPLCFAKTPADLVTNQTAICCNSSVTATTIGTTTCNDVIRSLTLLIYYSNPNGITGCRVTIIGGTATIGQTFEQTFNVKFFSNNASSTKTIRSGNPGYITGSSIRAATISGSSTTEVPFTVFQPSETGSCSTVGHKLVRFGQNSQSFCRLSPTTTTCLTDTDIRQIFTSNINSPLYVGIYGNSDLSNSDSRVEVIRCLSEIGSSDRPTCETGTFPSVSSGQCYVRLDIQIGYANTGAVTNPQQIIGTVVFHYQRLSSTATTTLTTPVIITQTVTFQDLSNAPVTANGLISRPNTRILGDFFYPFSLSRASNSFSTSLFSLIFIFTFFLVSN